jgi:mannosyltransferase OCH1-like enzyme
MAMIPATIHQMWKTGDVPARLAPYAESWRAMHPTWQYRLWTDAHLETFVREQYPEMWDLYRTYSEPIQRVDAVRYMLLHHFGGVYADLDVECVRSLEPLRQHGVVLAATAPLGVSNDLMMAMPRHALFEAVIQRLPRARARWDHWYVPRHFRVLLSTGSLHLTNTVARWPERGDLHVLSPELYSSQDRSRVYVYHWPGDAWAGWDTRLINGAYAGWRRARRAIAVGRRKSIRDGSVLDVPTSSVTHGRDDAQTRDLNSSQERGP